MLYFSLLILIVGVAFLIKFKMAKKPSQNVAKIGALCLLVSFILGLVSNLSDGNDKGETQKIDALERAKIMIPSSQLIQKWGSKGPIVIFLSQTAEGKSPPLQMDCIDQLRKQFPATELKVSELPYQSAVTEKQLDAACGKSTGGLILLCALPQENEKLDHLFMNEDQPKYRAHFLILSIQNQQVCNFFTSHRETFTILQSKQSNVSAMPENTSPQVLFDQFYETIPSHTEPTKEAKSED